MRAAVERKAEAPLLHTLLALLVAVPAFAVLWWSEGGQVVLVLYRQPKEAAVAVLGWFFLAAFCWRFRAGGPDGEPLLEALARPLRRRQVLLLALFLGWMVLTLLWARVPANGLVELRQYLALFLVLLVLLAWQRWDGRVARTLRLAWASSLGLVSAVGLLQLVVTIPWLSPINPIIGAPNPSFMGYKNPMALALLGQLFLLAEMAFPRSENAGREAGGGVWLWRLLLVIEVVHLGTLGSRTSLFALAVATVYLVVLAGLASWRRRRSLGEPRALLAIGAMLAIFVVALIVHPVGRAKTVSVLGFVSHPASYLESDRGIYLRNTLEMVRHNPLGVGLGDWQTHYPVFRAHGREVAFTDTHQVRRAHSDPVQFLGEGGWPALLLWLALLAWLVIGTARRALAGERRGLFLSAQVVAVALAMASDYLLDLPYGKLQFFLLLALLPERSPHSSTLSSREEREEEGKTSSVSTDRRLGKALAVVLALTFLVTVLYHGRLLRRSIAAAALQQGYQQWTAHGAEAVPFLLRRVEEYGPVFLASGGHTKTTHRDFLVLAHCAELLGRRDQALAWTRRTLELHPYYPPAYELMALLVDDPAAAEAWRSAHRHILDEARHGFDHPVPPLAPPPSVVE